MLEEEAQLVLVSQLLAEQHHIHMLLRVQHLEQQELLDLHAVTVA